MALFCSKDENCREFNVFLFEYLTKRKVFAIMDRKGENYAR